MNLTKPDPGWKAVEYANEHKYGENPWKISSDGGNDMMDFPKCPQQRTDCRFQIEGGSATCMHSPLIYDREGNAVGGGENRIVKSIGCNTCGCHWTSSQTELDDAQGKPREWIL